MKEKTKEKISNTLRIIIVSLLLSTAIGYSLADWAPPAGAPPFNNTPPPINVGSASQIRDGNLFLNNWLFAKKAETQSTVASDSGTTLVTKDYVDAMSAGWQVVPLTDVALFDTSCEYRFKTTNYTYQSGTVFNDGTTMATGSSSCYDRAVNYLTKGSAYVGCFPGGETVVSMWKRC